MRSQEEIDRVLDRIDNIGAEDFRYASAIADALDWIQGANYDSFPFIDSMCCGKCNGYGYDNNQEECEGCNGSGEEKLESSDYKAQNRSAHQDELEHRARDNLKAATYGKKIAKQVEEMLAQGKEIR